MCHPYIESVNALYDIDNQEITIIVNRQKLTSLNPEM